MNGRLFLILLFFLSLCVSAYTLIGPEESLDLFERAMREWSVGNSEKAYGYMKLAIEGEVYVTDLPEYWFMIAKLEMELGRVEEAREALSNVLILNPGRREVLNMLDIMDSLMHGIPKKNDMSHIGIFKRIHGFVEGVEYFYTPVDVDMRGEEVLVLDRMNKRLIISEGSTFQVIELSGTPRSLVYDPRLDRIYCSDVENGTIFFVDPKSTKVENLYSGLHYPVIFDIDRAGRVLVGDLFDDAIYMISHDGMVLRKYDLMEDGKITIFNDAKIVFERMYIQDLTNRVYRIVDILSGKKVGEIKFPYDDALPLSFDVDGYGGLMILWSDGKFTYVNEDGKIRELKLSEDEFSEFSRFKYRPPFILFVKPFDHSIVLCSVEREDPEYINIITAIDVGLKEIKLEFTINTFTGNCVSTVRPFLTAYDSGGRVSFSYRRKMVETKIYETRDLMGFLKNDLKKLNRRTKNYVLVYQEDVEEKKEILKFLLPVKMKNVTFYLLKNENTKVSPQLEDFVHISSGMILNSSEADELKNYLESSKYCMEEIEYPTTFSMRSVKPVTIRFHTLSHNYFDTIYYIGGFKLEKDE